MKNVAIDWIKVEECLEACADHVHTQISRDVMGKDRYVDSTAPCGDVVSKGDQVAEEAIRSFLREHAPYPVALLDEGSGTYQNLHDEEPVIGILADPIDGTRPAVMQFPAFAICLAAFPWKADPQVKDLEISLIRPINEPVFVARKGGGITFNGKPFAVSPEHLAFSDTKAMRLQLDCAGAPLALAAAYVAPLDVDQSYLRGRILINSTAYSATRLLVGGLHGMVHLGALIRREWPELRPQMEQMTGSLGGAAIWDIAPVALFFEEAGMKMVHADGQAGFQDVPLQSRSEGFDYAVGCSPDVQRKMLYAIRRQSIAYRQTEFRKAASQFIEQAYRGV